MKPTIVYVFPEGCHGVAVRRDSLGRVLVEFKPDEQWFPDGKYFGWYDHDEIRIVAKPRPRKRTKRRNK